MGLVREILVIDLNKIALWWSRNRQWMYDAETLTSVLRDAGFVNIKERCFRQGATPQLDELDNYEGVTLRIEATKPS